jgi:hypothetical protein
MILLDTDHLSVFTDERDPRHGLLNRHIEAAAEPVARTGSFPHRRDGIRRSPSAPGGAALGPDWQRAVSVIAIIVDTW